MHWNLCGARSDEGYSETLCLLSAMLTITCFAGEPYHLASANDAQALHLGRIATLRGAEAAGGAQCLSSEE